MTHDEHEPSASTENNDSESDLEADSSEPLTLAEEVGVLGESKTSRDQDEEGLEGEDYDDELEDDVDDEETEDENSLAYLLETRVARRAERQKAILRESLKGKISLTVHDTEQCYLYDWTSDEMTVRSGSVKELGSEEVDCRLELSEVFARAICQGELNPQIALLSEKIHLKGNGELATYFFNLLVPRR